MSQLIPFNFNQHAIRVIKDAEGEPWFVAKDVATGLGYSNTNKAISDHCKKAKSLNDIGVTIRYPYTNQQLASHCIYYPESDSVLLNQQLASYCFLTTIAFCYSCRKDQQSLAKIKTLAPTTQIKKVKPNAKNAN